MSFFSFSWICEVRSSDRGWMSGGTGIGSVDVLCVDVVAVTFRYTSAMDSLSFWWNLGIPCSQRLIRDPPREWGRSSWLWSTNRELSMSLSFVLWPSAHFVFFWIPVWQKQNCFLKTRFLESPSVSIHVGVSSFCVFFDLQKTPLWENTLSVWNPSILWGDWLCLWKYNRIVQWLKGSRCRCGIFPFVISCWR